MIMFGVILWYTNKIRGCKWIAVEVYGHHNRKKGLYFLAFLVICGRSRTGVEGLLVPPAGIEPALLSEPDFESGASTSSAKGAR